MSSNWLHVSMPACGSLDRIPVINVDVLSEGGGQAPRRNPHVALQPTVATARRTTASMHSRQGEIVRNFHLFSCDLRRKRRGSVSMMTPHQRWCVYDLKNRRHIVATKTKDLSPSLLSLSVHAFSHKSVEKAQATYHRDSAPLYAVHASVHDFASEGYF